MLFKNINSEQNLRDWLSDEIKSWNSTQANKVALEWIEPTFGSSMGVSDCKLTYRGETYGVELKHLLTTSTGICYKIRPVQRRYNVMGVRAGRKLLILASVANENCNELVAIRGDKVPLRDYCSHLGSGCENGIIQTKFETEPRFASFLIVVSTKSWWI